VPKQNNPPLQAKANTVTDHNESCLQLAARYGDVHICRKLLAKKAVVNFTDCAGATPLFVACAEGNHQVGSDVRYSVA